MKFLPLIWKNVWRRKFRTIFTLLSIFVAFLLFGILMTSRTAFSFGVDMAGLDRLIMVGPNKIASPEHHAESRRLLSEVVIPELRRVA